MSWAEVKHALNSTLGTDEFEPLDQLLSHGAVIIKESTVWNIPKGIKRIYVTACGGGGGGGNRPKNSNTTCAGSGGSGAAYIVRKLFSVEGMNSLDVTVGKGGMGGKAGNNSSEASKGTNGEATIVGDLITLAGGNAGVYEYDKYTEGVPPNGGYGGKALDTVSSSSEPHLETDVMGGKGAYIDGMRIGDVEYLKPNNSVPKSSRYGGYGGCSLGAGGVGMIYYADRSIIHTKATDGGYGAGGGGGYGSSMGTIADAGNGGDGIVIIEW